MEFDAYTAWILTVSDRCARGERVDASGPALLDLLEEEGFDVLGIRVVPDERDQIVHALLDMLADDPALVVTTGGTGLSRRDVTPEATLEVLERQVPGIPEAMRAASMAVTPNGCLSRGVAGTAGGSLVVNVPGSPKAAVENIGAVLPAIDHGIRMLRGGQADCAAGH